MGRPEKSVTETESLEPAATERASCVVGEYLRGSYDITCSDRVIFGSGTGHDGKESLERHPIKKSEGVKVDWE